MTLRAYTNQLWAHANNWRRYDGQAHEDRWIACELGVQLASLPNSFAERAELFRELVREPEVMTNPDISTFVLDPLLGVPSLALQVEEKKFSEDVLSIDGDGNQTSLGHDPTVIYVSYGWIHQVLSQRPPEDHRVIMDMGAGIGRVGLYIRAFEMQLRYVGVEIVLSRVRAYHNATGTREIIHRDIRQVPLQGFDTYFFFNPFSNQVLLDVMARIAKKFRKAPEPFRIVQFASMVNLNLGGMIENRIEVPVPKGHIIREYLTPGYTFGRVK